MAGKLSIPDLHSRIEFTRAQIECLDKQYPEMIGNCNTSADELRWRAAQRSVLYFIKSRVTTGVPE